MTDPTVRTDIQRLLERVRVAADDLESASRLLHETSTNAEVRHYFERLTAASNRFQSHDLALRAALDAITCSN
jgi:hypothetical protein